MPGARKAWTADGPLAICPSPKSHTILRIDPLPPQTSLAKCIGSPAIGVGFETKMLPTRGGGYQKIQMSDLTEESAPPPKSTRMARKGLKPPTPPIRGDGPPGLAEVLPTNPVQLAV